VFTPRRRRSTALFFAAALTACPPPKGNEAATTAGQGEGGVVGQPDGGKPVQTVKEPLPPLRTGTRGVGVARALSGRIAAVGSDKTHQYLELSFAVSGDEVGYDYDRMHVEAGDGALGVVTAGIGSSDVRVLVRRELRSGGGPPGGDVSGALYAKRWDDGVNVWIKLPFVATDLKSASDDKELAKKWVEAMARELGDSWSSPHPWYAFAAGRLWAILPEGLKAGAGPAGFDGRERVRTDLSKLMDTTTGVLSMQEALQHDRGLRLRGDRQQEERTIPVKELRVPPLDAHPFAAMQAKLTNPGGGTAEPMAAAVPAEFWYARVDDIRLLLRLLDEADTWITPLVQILQTNPEDRFLADRYQRQLGLRRTELAKLFGHTVVGEVAITGSDAYLREGSDVTMIFKIRQQAIFDQELGKHLEAYKAEIPGLVTTTRDYNGVTITESRDPGGTVRQQRAQVGDLALVSNSPKAAERVLDAMAGRAPRLGDEPDMRYMLARDPGAHQALAFLSDKFIAAVIGPQQKVLAARRQQALAELMTPGNAALLYGWLGGRAPASTDELVASGLLAAEELKHADGAAIAFTPGGAASSSWGKPAALTPIIDLPPVTTVSAAEKEAYEQFGDGYQRYWKQFIDPVAIRLDIKDTAEGAAADVDVRILPLISATDYSEIEEVVGATRVHVQQTDNGLLGVWAVGADARLRRDLDGMMRAISGKSDIGLGWLGSWVAVGLEDRAALVELLSKFDDTVQLANPKPKGNEFEDTDLWRRIGKFPVYAAAEVKNPAALVATLTGIRTMVNEVAPGMVEWGEAARHRDLPIVRIGIGKSAPMLPNRDIAEAVALHYVQTGSAIVLALDVPTLQAVIDRMLDGKLPKGAENGSSQFVFEGHSGVGAPLWTALLWMIQGQANGAQRSARRSAEILLMGDPATRGDAKVFVQRGLDYFGFTPVTAHGTTDFVLGPGGAGDPLLGSEMAPVFVDLPIPGSPVDRLMQRLTRVRGEVSFDKEPDPAGPNARSLHTRFSLHLGPEK
jgi:hypothetical protein